jgi:hypothetical protein
MNTLHANFNGGLMSQKLAGRFDLEKIRTGCVQLKNMLPTPFGGVFKRPGFLHVERQRDDTEKARLIPFRRSTEVNFALEWGDDYMRVIGQAFEAPVFIGSGDYELGEIVQYGSSPNFEYWVCHTSYTFNPAGAPWADPSVTGKFTQIGGPTASTTTDVVIDSPYSAAEVFDLQYRQLNDVMFLTHPDHFPRRLTRVSDTHWQLEKVPFEFAPYLDLNETRIAVQVQYAGINKWADSWATATAYKAGDIIQGTGATVGRIYTCIADHTSAALTQPGVGANSATVWTQIATGYAVGDRVLGLTAPYEGQIFTCHTAHGSATADAVDEPGAGSAWESYWNLGTSSVTVAAWAAGTTYSATNKVRWNSVIYECRQSHVASAPINGRFGKSGGNRPSDGQAWTSFWKISSAGNDLSGLAFNLVATESLFTSSDVGTNWLLEIGTTGRYDSIILSAGTAIGPIEPLFIQGSFLVTTTWNSASAMLGSLAIEESLDGVTWSKIKDWNQTAANDGNISYDGTAPDVGAWYRISAARTSGGAGGVMKIEAVSSVIKMPFLIESYTSATSVGGKLITVNDQLPPAAAIGVSTTNYRKPAFSPTEGYPRAVCFHDGRIWYGGTRGKGSRIWGGELDDFYNFLTGSLDDSGLDVTLGATEANDILWLASHNRAMIVGTSGQEWTIDGGDAETVITPTKARARMRTKHGSYGIQPEVVAESLLWVSRSGRSMREFTYSFQVDGYTAPDMTQLVGLLDGKIVQTAYQSSPTPIVWAVTDTGKLYSFTYDREQSVTAWAMHTTGNADGHSFESVAVIYGNDIDEVYVTTLRGSYRFIERLHSPTLKWIMDERKDSNDEPLCFVDAAQSLTYSASGSPAAPGFYTSGSNILAWLNDGFIEAGSFITASLGWQWPDSDSEVGIVVVAFVGHYEAPALTNMTGVAGSWFYGLPVLSTVQGFPLDAQLQDGTGQGRHWRANRVQLILDNSLGGKYAANAGDFGYAFGATGYSTGGFDIEYPSGTDKPFTGRIDLHIGSDWGPTTEFTIQHDDPVPFGLLGYVLKGEVSGS